MARKVIEQETVMVSTPEGIPDYPEKPEDGKEAEWYANRLIIQAATARASDLHIEMLDEDAWRVRVRIDGVPVPFQEVRVMREGREWGIDEVPPSWISRTIGRLFIMAGIGAQEQHPQDGAFMEPVECRVNTTPIESRIRTQGDTPSCMMIIRIFEELPEITADDWAHERDYSAWSEMTNKPNGLIVLSGPTGSGKSTTIQNALRRFAEEGRIVSSIEDPVEVRIPGMRQSQPNTRVTFPQLLRSLARTDSDVLFIGEVRDNESASTAVQLALRGRLVFTTIHANDAPSTLISILEMGVKPSTLAAVLGGIVSQRLVGKTCTACMGESPETCPECAGSGYRGRTAVHEVMRATPDVVEAIEDQRSVAHIRRLAHADEMGFLYDRAMLLVEKGITTKEEVLRAVGKVQYDLQIRDTHRG